MRTGTKIGLALAGLAGIGIGLLAYRRSHDEQFITDLWHELEEIACGKARQPSLTEDLPEPARRYLQHAISPDAPLVSAAKIHFSGEIIATRTIDIDAVELVVPGAGFIWRTRARMDGIRLTGDDYYFNNTAQMQIRLLGLVPVVNATGPNVVRSARGRFALEHTLFPPALLPGDGVTWRAIDDEHAQALIFVDDETTPVTITVGPGGELREVVGQRFNADPSLGPVGMTTFGGVIEAEGTFAGYTIPTSLRLGWHYGTPEYRETFRLTVTDAEFC